MPDGTEIDTVNGLKISVTAQQARKSKNLKASPTAAYG